MKQGQSLAERTADDILSMLCIDKKFAPGDKIPNENDLSAALSVSRTTLREAIRILAAHQVLEIRRGRGTYVRADFKPEGQLGLEDLSPALINIRDLFEVRLIFEPQAAFYAASRATEAELERILYYGRLDEEQLLRGVDRTEAEQAFHNSIACATHNAFLTELMPMLYESIGKAVALAKSYPELMRHTLEDHRQIMDFLAKHNPEGARTAMQLHMIHAMEEMNLE